MLSRAALVATLVLVVGLTACGRKGPLEAPPGASLTDDHATTTATPDATKPKKSFFLDPLLN
jgi:predicted small lipoprotein YifL